MSPERRSGLRRSRKATLVRVLLSLALIAGAYFSYVHYNADGAEPPAAAAVFTPDRVVQAPNDGAIEIDYGPARITVETGSRVVLPGAGLFHGREVTLEKGSVRARVDQLARGRRFSVRTFNCVAGVRGTDFKVAIVDGGNTVVDVEEGRIWVENMKGDTLILGEGHRTVVTLEERPIFIEKPSPNVFDDIPRQGTTLSVPPPAAPVVMPMKDETERPAARLTSTAAPGAEAPAQRVVGAQGLPYDPSLDPANVAPENLQPLNPAPSQVQPRSYN